MSTATLPVSPLSPGLTEGVPMEDYREAEGVSASDLKNLQRSPLYARMRSHTTTPAQEWGTAVHTAILEPDTLDTRYRVDPEKPEVGGYPAGWRNTNAYKEAKATLLAEPGVEGVLTASQRADLARIQDRVASNQIGRKMHDLPGVREASVLAWDDASDLWRKCRPDWWIPAARMIVDVKTAQDHRPGAFARACHRYGYHLSAAYYLDTFELAGLEAEHFVFLVVSADAPYEVASYTLDDDSIEQGRHDYRAALAEWRDCVNAGQWPGGSDVIEEIRLPAWAIDYFEKE
jgi:exodeoxyribonuclease VIII